MNTVPDEKRLDRLPLSRQKQIVALVTKKGLPAAAARATKLTDRPVSEEEVVDFSAWFHISRNLEQAASCARSVREGLGRFPDLNLDEESITLAAQFGFEQQAAREDNVELFIKLRRLRQKDRELAARESRGKPAAGTSLKNAGGASNPSDDEHWAEIRRILGMTPE
jgi:hypothetical protein